MLNPQDLLTTEELANLLRLHIDTVRRYVREGTLPAVKIGKRYLIHRADIEQLLSKDALINSTDKNEV